MKKQTKVNKQTKMLHAAYAIRGRAAALLAAYVAFDPIGAQTEDIERFYELACGICWEMSDNPSVNWDWLEVHRPKIPSAAYRDGWTEYLGDIRRKISIAEKSGLARYHLESLREDLDYIANEI